MTYTNGTYAKSGSQVYFALVTGVSSNLGSGPAGMGDIIDKTVTWRSCSSQPRRHLAICNNATNSAWDVYVSDQSPAASGKGWRIAPLGGSLVLTGTDCPQGEIYIIMPTGTGNVSTVSW